MAKAKILVVEDESITAKDVQYRLKDVGYDVPAIAMSGEGAIKKAEEIKPDLVLMDIVLKGDMDGIEAAGHIRDRFNIPVVYLTAYIDEERLEKTKFTEPYGYLIKPFEDTELRLAIEMALQRHKLEIALRNAEENWRISFNSLDDIMLIIDRDYTIENINAKGLKLLGKSKEEVIGKKCYQAISGVDSPIKECPCMKSMETKKVESLDWYNTRFGKYFSIKSSPIFDEKGKIVKFIDLMRDITERKQAEDALHESEEMARALLNASFDSVLLLDTDGTILALNESAARRIGMSAVKLIGLCCFDLFPTEIAERRKACNDKVIRSGKPINFTDQRGGFLFNTMIYPVFDTEGKVTRLAVFVHDITEQVWSEEQIKASLMEKEVLIKEIHQRVKNNLQVVSSLLNMQARTTENKDAFAILSESRGMINAMGLIHSQLYEGEDLSKINMKRFMDKLMEQLFQIYSVPETRISPVIHAVECSLPISIAVPVGLIVNELLTNAFKYAFVKRKVGKIEVSLRASEKGVVNLTVSDDGVGLPDGFDVNASKTLGLRVVKILAEDQLDGKLKVVSKDGTTVKVEFEINGGRVNS